MDHLTNRYLDQQGDDESVLHPDHKFPHHKPLLLQLKKTNGVRVSRSFIKPLENGQAESRTYEENRNVMGVQIPMFDQDRQKRVINKFFADNQVDCIYCYHAQGCDQYLILTTDDESDTVERMSGIYWSIFDEDPEYSFEFSTVPSAHFTESIVPEGAQKMNRGNWR